MPGFLPTRGSFMLDVVALAMVGVVILMAISIGLVKKKKYQTHKRLQTLTSVCLLIAVVMFELEMRLHTNWRELAGPSRFYASGIVDLALLIHLMFAVPTPFVWGFVLVQALRNFSRPPGPGDHSASHKKNARIAVAMMTMTAVTGWTFYLLAFVL